MHIKFFAVIIMIAAMFAQLIPARATEERQRMTQEEAYVIGKFIDAFGGIASEVINHRRRDRGHGYYQPQPRYHGGNLYFQPQPRNEYRRHHRRDYDRYYDEPQPRIRNPGGNWLHEGGGSRIREGQYCRGIMQYDPYSQGYYCLN